MENQDVTMEEIEELEQELDRVARTITSDDGSLIDLFLTKP